MINKYEEKRRLKKKIKLRSNGNVSFLKKSSTFTLIKDVTLLFLLVSVGFIFYFMLNQMQELQLIVENLKNTVDELVLSNKILEQNILSKNLKIKELETFVEILKKGNRDTGFWITVGCLTAQALLIGGMLYYGTKILPLKVLLPTSFYDFLKNNTRTTISEDVRTYEFYDKARELFYRLIFTNNEPKIYTRKQGDTQFSDSSEFTNDFIFMLIDRIKILENSDIGALFALSSKSSTNTPGSTVMKMDFEEMAAVVDALTVFLQHIS